MIIKIYALTAMKGVVSMDQITITSIKNEDVATLSEICKKTYGDTFKEAVTPEDLETYFKEAYNHEILLDELNNKNSWYYFAKLNGEVAGYMKLNIGDAQTEEMGDDYLEVQRLYMYKEYQSKGIGSQLMTKAFEVAKNQNKKKLWLGVWEENHRALNFYKRHGYEVVGSHQFITGNDISTDYIVETNVKEE